MGRSELAGKRAPPEILVDVARLVTAYYTLSPDPAEPSQRVAATLPRTAATRGTWPPRWPELESAGPSPRSPAPRPARR